MEPTCLNIIYSFVFVYAIHVGFLTFIDRGTLFRF
ncbi:MAG: hypothetical protein BWZ11_00009 [Bacteroidetes bacterium ADurb.BinA395]|nr:MAG: hypothetical protein BWZ11_00009 [Bacteroidetes bacterium ADurb.BinA395]